MMTAEAFSPDWISPPGETVRDALQHRNLSDEALSQTLGLNRDSVGALLSGDLEIDGQIAQGLSTLVGGTYKFWLAREAYYRARLEAQRTPKMPPDFEDFLAALPIKDMRAFGWLAGMESLSSATAVRRFFEDTPGDWVRSGAQISDAVRFRTSTAHETNPVAVAAWLRQGVLQARAMDCAPWNPAALSAAISEIRPLSRIKAPEIFFPKLADICRACGVAVVFVRTPKGCRASGATHFASDDKAIIQLSFRYRSDDHFWFTVFHEIGHLLLHPETPLFVEGQDYEGTEEETQANTFAAQVLVPPEHAKGLGTVARNFRAILRLARTIGVSPGIVVGQMQNRGLIRHDQFNFLKTRYNWDDLNRIIP